MKVWLQHFTAALGAYGPWGIFLLNVMDSLGVPLPAALDVALITIAAGSVNYPRFAWFAAAMAVLGSIVGNVALFWAARRGAGWLRQSEPEPGKPHRFRNWFDQYGLLTVFVPAVTPIVPLPLKVFVIMAAAMRISFVRFLLVILVGRCVRCFGLVYLGLLLGKDAHEALARHGWTLAGLALAVGAAGYLLARYIGHRRQPAL